MLVLVAALTIVGVGAVSAAPACSAAGGTAEVALPADGDSVVLAVGNGDDEGKIVFGTPGADLAPCGGATVSTTDTVVVTGGAGTQTLRIALASDPFEPGATMEAEGISEIEFAVDLGAGTDRVIVGGGEEADWFVAGSDGVNVNAAETVDDVDVELGKVEWLSLEGAKGNDTLSAGGEGTGGPVSGMSVTLSGGDDADHLTGGPGDDWLSGGAGDDLLDGGQGHDTAAYSGAASGVAVDLAAGTATGGDGSDSLAGIENVVGSDFADTIVGDDGGNLLNGRVGDDAIDGGGGDDAVTYSSATSGVTVDLSAGTASGGEGVDSLTALENVIGSSFDDVLTGTAGPNQLIGGSGEDALHGRGGSDRLIGGRGGDLLRGGSGDDLVLGQGGVDVARGGPGDDVLVGGGGDDRLSGGAGEDFLRGGPAMDLCRGGPGTNVLRSCER